MLLKNSYYWFKEVLTPKFCDDVIKYGNSKNKKTALIGGIGENRDLNKNPLTKKEIKNLQKIRKSEVIWMTDQWIYKEIIPYVKIANQSNSDHVNDGLKIKNTFITPALKCVPPGDKPLNDELKNCFGYFKSEFEILKNLKIIVALGKIAFDTCVKFYRENFDYTERVKFGHGTYFKLPNNVLLMGCYHPSPRNVNTGRINEKQMTKLFKKVKELV